MDPRTLEATADDLDRQASYKRDESDTLLRDADTMESEARDTRAEAVRLRDEEIRAAAREREAESQLTNRGRPWPF